MTIFRAVQSARRAAARRREREEGQMLVVFVLFLIVIMLSASIVIDLGLLRNTNQKLWNALDAGALAGVSQLPDHATQAQTVALQYANGNLSGLNLTAANVSFYCLIGSTTSGGTNVPNVIRDVPLVCDPGTSASTTTASPPWSCNGSICTTPCNPLVGMCNTIALSDVATQSYHFGNVVGIGSGQTGAVVSAACKGPCGASPTVPVDVVLIVDRTQSMNGVDTSNARAAADSLRNLYNPAVQWLGLGMTGPSQSGACLTTPAAAIGTAAAPLDVRRWIPVALSGVGAPVNEVYTTGGTKLASGISCFTNSSTGTDLADPILMATYELTHNGRTGVKKGIILETDGQPNAAVPLTNATNPGNYCAQANTAATAAKAAGIEIFTIGFGLDGSNDALCPDTSGPFKSRTATYALASIATQPSSNAYGCPGSGPTNSNNRRRSLLLPAEDLRRQHRPVCDLQVGGHHAGRHEPPRGAPSSASRRRPAGRPGTRRDGLNWCGSATQPLVPTGISVQTAPGWTIRVVVGLVRWGYSLGDRACAARGRGPTVTPQRSSPCSSHGSDPSGGAARVAAPAG